MPQDGRINVRIKGEEIDIRVSTVPTVWGESVSLRLLTRGKIFFGLDRLGFGVNEEAQIRDIIVKPLFGNGGAGVFHIRPDDENLNALLEMFTQRSREPVIVQRYLPEVRSGDKRIILIDGEIGGGLLRIPAAGEARANLHVGGKAVKTALTRREHEICERLGPELRARGLVFVGIDVIGDYLTEINVTSPTGIQEIGRYDGVDLAGRIWDAIERRVAEGRARR